MRSFHALLVCTILHASAFSVVVFVVVHTFFILYFILHFSSNPFFVVVVVVVPIHLYTYCIIVLYILLFRIDMLC